MRLLRVILLLFVFFVANYRSLAYRITGSLRNMTCFYPHVYLAVINNLDGLFSISSQDVISSADLDSIGNFCLTGNDLPEAPGLYRLYVTADKGSDAAIYMGQKRNYILLALDNKSQLNMECSNFCTTFFRYSVTGAGDNEAIAALQQLFNGFDSLRWSSHWSTLGTFKKQFLEDKYYGDLKQFADTSHSLIAGALAVTIMGIDSNYNKDNAFFRRFATRFREKSHFLSYSAQLDKKIQMLDLKQESGSMRTGSPILVVLSILLVLSVLLNIYFILERRKPGSAPSPVPMLAPESNDENYYRSLIDKLTIKEREILKMVNDGLSNKEIAATLNVEVSTVKTHVSNIYQKLEISNRKEVAGIARYL